MGSLFRIKEVRTNVLIYFYGNDTDDSYRRCGRRRRVAASAQNTGSLVDSLVGTNSDCYVSRETFSPLFQFLVSLLQGASSRHCPRRVPRGSTPLGSPPDIQRRGLRWEHEVFFPRFRGRPRHLISSANNQRRGRRWEPGVKLFAYTSWRRKTRQAVISAAATMPRLIHSAGQAEMLPPITSEAPQANRRPGR